METVSIEVQSEAIKSFQSTISKCETAIARMTQKGSNTDLLKKRLTALEIGLAVLENAWFQKTHAYSPENLADARQILNGLMPSIEHSYAKSKLGSPQRTLLERRIQSLKFALQALDEVLMKDGSS